MRKYSCRHLPDLNRRHRLLVAALAVFAFAGIATVSTVIDLQPREFNTEGPRLQRRADRDDDLILLGTVLPITRLGLYELFLIRASAS